MDVPLTLRCIILGACRQRNKKNTAFCRVVLFWRTYSFSLKNNAPEGFARSALPTLCGNRNDFGALYFRNLLLVEPFVASQLFRVQTLGNTENKKTRHFAVLFYSGAPRRIVIPIPLLWYGPLSTTFPNPALLRNFVGFSSLVAQNKLKTGKCRF